jgi:Zn-dependent protease
MWSLSSSFASLHPDWSAGAVHPTALGAAIAFFASVLVHELAHSLVARFVYALPVRDITLHVLEGVSSLEREPPTPLAELVIAIVGPISSVVLGVAMLFAGAVVTGPFPLRGVVDPTRALSSLGPVSTLLVWLGPVDVMVGLFNMIPGFPLDGGRVLRALLWMTTGSL